MTRPVALITGSWRRLGAAIAVRLADEGYDIALHAGHEATLEPGLTAQLTTSGADHRLFVADLDERSETESLTSRVCEHFGREITLLVNNASRFEAIATGAARPYDDLLAHVGVNVAAPFALACAVARGAGQGGAAVVNILDQRIARPPRDQIAYTLSKQALAQATRTLAVALAPRVRVNGVAPGLTLPTPDYTPGQLDRLADAMPLRRLPSPEDVADAVAFLAGARSVTGETIFVDGGSNLVGFDRDFVHLMR